jgi:hypothetical protein
MNPSGSRSAFDVARVAAIERSRRGHPKNIGPTMLCSVGLARFPEPQDENEPLVA